MSPIPTNGFGSRWAVARLVAIATTLLNCSDRRHGFETVVALGHRLQHEPNRANDLSHLIDFANGYAGGGFWRVQAIETLGELGRSHPKEVAGVVVPFLRRLLTDPSPRIPAPAARSLGDFGIDASSAVPDLLALMERGRTTDAEWNAMEALGKIGSDTDRVTTALCRRVTEGLGGRTGPPLNSALQGLTSLGSRARGCLPTLVRGLSHKDEEVRVRVGGVVVKIDPSNEAVMPAMFTVCETADSQCVLALLVVRDLNTRRFSPEVMPILRVLVRSSNPEVAQLARELCSEGKAVGKDLSDQ
jgi:hypothetical protein